MWLDADKLSEFYRTPLGQMTHRSVSKALEEIWPNAKDEIILGFGFGYPYLDMFRGEAERVLSFMPAPQGAIAWPKGRKNRVALVEETQWPLLDQSIDRVIFIHAFEFSDRIHELLQEAWRVLRCGGEILIVAPNRRGAWSQTTTTPFGYGTPFTGHQLYDIFTQTGFTPLKPQYCLYTPPTGRRLIHKFAPTFEKFSGYFWPKLGGVLLFPAKKQVLALTLQKSVVWMPRLFKPTVPRGF
jgi:SAM-dependent methyltransferase